MNKITYKEVQSIYKEKYGRIIKSCWIADIKRELNLTKRKAYNRINDDRVEYPCPENIKENLMKIIKDSYNIT
ncbi:MAG: hypothetical protein ACPGTO_10525 [Polaribacter sp.]